MPLKVVLPDESRRLPENWLRKTFAQFEADLCQLTGLRLGTYSVVYRDDQNDRITMTSEEEWKEAIRIQQTTCPTSPSGHVVTVFVVNSHRPSACQPPRKCVVAFRPPVQRNRGPAVMPCCRSNPALHPSLQAQLEAAHARRETAVALRSAAAAAAQRATQEQQERNRKRDAFRAMLQARKAAAAKARAAEAAANQQEEDRRQEEELQAEVQVARLQQELQATARAFRQAWDEHFEDGAQEETEEPELPSEPEAEDAASVVLSDATYPDEFDSDEEEEQREEEKCEPHVQSDGEKEDAEQEPAAVQQLMAMGFTQTEAELEAVLTACDGDLRAALTVLLHQ